MLSFPVVRVLVIAAVAATDALVILVDAPTGRILLAVGQTVGGVLIYALVARAAAARERRATLSRLAAVALRLDTPQSVLPESDHPIGAQSPVTAQFSAD